MICETGLCGWAVRLGFDVALVVHYNGDVWGSARAGFVVDIGDLFDKATWDEWVSCSKHWDAGWGVCGVRLCVGLLL
jgi:hypothetical protein